MFSQSNPVMDEFLDGFRAQSRFKLVPEFSGCRQRPTGFPGRRGEKYLSFERLPSSFSTDSNNNTVNGSVFLSVHIFPEAWIKSIPRAIPAKSAFKRCGFYKTAAPLSCQHFHRGSFLSRRASEFCPYIISASSPLQAYPGIQSSPVFL